MKQSQLTLVIHTGSTCLTVQINSFLQCPGCSARMKRLELGPQVAHCWWKKLFYALLPASAYMQTFKRFHGMQAVTREDFLLPTLGAKLEGFREEVRTGRGFQLFRCTRLNLSCKALTTDDLNSQASATIDRVQLA